MAKTRNDFIYPLSVISLTNSKIASYMQEQAQSIRLLFNCMTDIWFDNGRWLVDDMVYWKIN